jgi:hypothetical protein
MNPRTLVSVHCYEGDQHQVKDFLPWYMHHECPVIIMSPEDSPVIIRPHICHHAGRRAYIGQESLDRQRKHLEILLGYPHDFFLLNDSDSFCISPELPKYLYEESQYFWSNECGEPRPHPSPYPKIAMQPPYFVSRRNLERMVRVAPRIAVHPITPYIDWFMLAMVYEAGIEHRPFTCKERSTGSQETDPWEQLYARTRHGGCLFHHPIKHLDIAKRLDEEHRKFKNEQSS